MINRYQVRGVKLLNTSLTGTIEYDFVAGETMSKPSLFRQQHNVYWRLSDEG